MGYEQHVTRRRLTTFYEYRMARVGREYSASSLQDRDTFLPDLGNTWNSTGRLLKTLLAKKTCKSWTTGLEG